MSLVQALKPALWSISEDLLRCISCGGSPRSREDAFTCPNCGRSYPIRDGIVVVNDDLAGNNRVVRDYYNGPLWPRFRFWEWLTFACNGGERRSRDKVLRHLPRNQADLRLLDVAIGDGVYLDWLPSDWEVVGIDISTSQLADCRKRSRGARIPLVLGEAEDLPFPDNRFDAVLSIGGFNYFNDPEASLREMARVVRPGGSIVISDEIPNLTDRMKLGRLIGWPGLDRWVIGRVTRDLGGDFTEIVEQNHHLDVAAIGRRVLGEHCSYDLIWQGVGYVMHGTVEKPSQPGPFSAE